jgi:hypothetical protein
LSALFFSALRDGNLRVMQTNDHLSITQNQYERHKSKSVKNCCEYNTRSQPLFQLLLSFFRILT